MPFRDKIYSKIVAFTIKFRVLTLSVFLAFFVYALFLGTQLNIQIFPPIGSPYFTINLNVPLSNTLTDKKWLAQEVEEKVQSLDRVISITTLIGADFPRIDPSINFKGDIIFLVKVNSGDEATLKSVMAETRQHLKPLTLFADMSLSLFQLQDLDYQSDFTLELSGQNVDALKQYAKKIDATIRKVEGIENVVNPMKSEQLMLKIDFLPESAQMLGVAKRDIDFLISMLTYGKEIDRFRDNTGKEFPLLLKIDPNPNNPFDIFRMIEVDSQSGGKVPLSELLDISLVPGETRILHHQYKPLVEIDCYLDASLEANQGAQRVLKAVHSIGIPDGIELQIGGALKSSQQTVSGFARNIFFIGALIFSIFVIQFRSFQQPFIIFSAVPMCVIGALIAISISGQPMSFFAAVGITSLMGIVVNDSILLVDEANKLLLEQPQKSLQQIALEAGQKRFMPVILTSLTTIAGLIPLALSDSMFKSMAIAIIGGLTSSTLLILLLVPVLYTLLTRKPNHVKTN